MDPSQVAAAGPEPVRGCTLSTVGQLARVAEFDQLFAGMAVRAERPAPTHLRLELRRDPAAARRAAELAVAETACCSFFTFTLTAAADRLFLEIAVPDAHLPALAALAGRATAQVPA
jgi:hypothetical protein